MCLAVRQLLHPQLRPRHSANCGRGSFQSSFVLLVINFIDRINIGFAALTMNKELAITNQQFGLLVGVFFFGYCVFEIPSNLLLHKMGARIWIARILISWGILATL